MSCRDSDHNAYDCVLYAYPDGKASVKGRFLLIRDLPCDCPLNTVDPKLRRVQARELKFIGYDAERGRIILVDHDALFGPV